MLAEVIEFPQAGGAAHPRVLAKTGGLLVGLV